MKLLKPLTASDRKWLQRSRRILLVGFIIGLIGLLTSTVHGDLGPYTINASVGYTYTYPMQSRSCVTSDGSIHVVFDSTYYESTDGGATWSSTVIVALAQPSAIACDKDDNLIIAVADNGASKVKSFSAPVNKAGSPWSWTFGSAVTIYNSGSSIVDVTTDNNGYYHVSYQSGSPFYVMWAVSIDHGATWTYASVTCFGTTGGMSAIVASPITNSLYIFFWRAGQTYLQAAKITYTAYPESWSIGGCNNVSTTAFNLHAWTPVALPNGRLAFLFGTAAGNLRFRISTNADDLTAWDAEVSLESSGVWEQDKALAVMNNTWLRSYSLYTNVTSSYVGYKESLDAGGTWGSFTVLWIVGKGAAGIEISAARSMSTYGWLSYTYRDNDAVGKLGLIIGPSPPATTTTIPGTTTTTTTITTTTTPSAYDLSGACSGIGDALGISDDAGCMLLSFILLFMILVPLGMLTKNFWVILIVGFTFAGFLTAVQWLPLWIMLMLCLVTALMLGSRLTGMISRGGSEESD